MKFFKGQRFINLNAYILEVINADEKYITYKPENSYAECITIDQFLNILKYGNFKEVKVVKIWNLHLKII